MIRLTDVGIWCYVNVSGQNWQQELLDLRSMILIPIPEGTPHPWGSAIGMLEFLRCDEEGRYRFPRGLAPELIGRLESRGYTVEWDRDSRQIREFDDRGWDRFDALLHGDEQRWAAKAMSEHREGICSLFTRFGKTYALAASWVRSGRPQAIIVVPRTAIASQTAQELTEWLGEEVGVVCSSVAVRAKLRRLTVVSVKSLVRKDPTDPFGYSIRPEFSEWLWWIEACYIDEGHIAGAQLWALHLATPNRLIQWAASATPFVRDAIKDTMLVGFTGPIRLEMKAKEGAKRGLIAWMQVRWYTMIYPLPNGSSIAKKTPWQEYYTEMVVNNGWRNTVISHLANHHLEQGESVVIFVERVEHGKILAAMIPGAEANVGNVKQAEKERMKAEINSGKLRCCVVTKRWREGITLAVDVVINAEGMQADHVQIQKSGRGLMPKASGCSLSYYDFVDDDQPRGLLKRWSDARSRTYTSEGWPQINCGEIAAL